tara:strand:- start:201 stop:1007 length:807 start_codon:yes stop_codon:yes gene_type:complete
MYKTAICFWGITRYLEGTITSIRKNIFQPASKFGEFKVFCHFFNLKTLNNDRSGENNIYLENNWHLFKADKLLIDEPNFFINDYLPHIKNYGDAFNDNYKSVRNLLHALYSLKKVFNSIEAYNADSFIFVRPDLIYYDSIEKYLYKSLITKKDNIFLPAWQPHYGFNDRFSICSSRNAATTYSQRINYAIDFCKANLEPLHSERLLKYVIKKNGCKVTFISSKASRVRANKIIKNENFFLGKHIFRVFIQDFFLNLILVISNLKKKIF